MEGRLRIEHCIVIDMARDEIVEYHEDQRAFSRDEVVRLLRDAGFQTVRCASDRAGSGATDKAFGTYVCAMLAPGR